MAYLQGQVPLPPSQFSRLLKASKFAAFDPAIRQTYGSPAAHAHRGDWGLKRPLDIKRKGAFISLPTNFEHRAMFTEWSRAENQVRLVRKFEELQVHAEVDQQSPWSSKLSRHVDSRYMLDSEFNLPEEGPEAGEDVDAAAFKTAQPTPVINAQDRKDLGSRGARQYSVRRPLNSQRPRTTNDYVAPSIDAMSPKKFEKFLETLHDLRPEFRTYLHEAQKTKARAENASNSNPNGTPLDIDSILPPDIFIKAESANRDFSYSRFIAYRTMKSFADKNSEQIVPRPHFNGGLTYTRISPLFTHFYAPYHPGLALEPDMATSKDIRPNLTKGGPTPLTEPKDYLVSLGGFVVTVDAKESKRHGLIPAFDHTHFHELRERTKVINAVAPVRIAPKFRIHNSGKKKSDGFTLVQLPLVVGPMSMGAKGVRMTATAEVMPGPWSSEAYIPLPGSLPYSLAEDGEEPVTLSRKSGRSSASRKGSGAGPSPNLPKSQWNSHGARKSMTDETRTNIIGNLRSMIVKRPAGKVPTFKSNDLGL